MNSGDLARLALDEHRAGDCAYTLYARDRDSAPCPLIGCERPHSIQLARLRCAEEGFDLQHCNNRRIPSDIVFELKPNTKVVPKKTPLKLFRKPSVVYSAYLYPGYVHTLPPVLLTVLKTLFQKGPQTQGIFRKCASAKGLRELREKIDSQGAVVCEEIANAPPLLLAGLLKDFLRSLPEPLLSGSPTVAQRSYVWSFEQIRRLINQLPRENHLLLAHVICVLNAIAKKSKVQSHVCS
ncbi:unnamed protein product [Callosobruchus maculatus]|uniref:Rho-GAP domain-containing protein n=1 Tax=Callosobruchus maculatus TaxID=64391 RepID=A0A653C649_CALMS|nr:unnamed protein product [Callosobruchus maculatus]